MNRIVKNLILVTPAVTAAACSSRENSLGTEIPRSMNKLFSNESWKGYKRIWKKLSELEPTSSKAMGLYHDALSYEESEEIQNELKALLPGLMRFSEENPGLLSPKVYSILDSVIHERVAYLTFGGQFLFTRMIPDFRKMHIEELAEELEERIDMLIELKKKDILDELAVPVALKNITDQVILSYSNTLYLKWYNISAYKDTDDSIFAMFGRASANENQIRKRVLKMNFTKLYEEGTISEDSLNLMNEEIDRLFKEVEEIEKLLPEILLLISELESE